MPPGLSGNLALAIAADALQHCLQQTDQPTCAQYCADMSIVCFQQSQQITSVDLTKLSMLLPICQFQVLLVAGAKTKGATSYLDGVREVSLLQDRCQMQDSVIMECHT